MRRSITSASAHEHIERKQADVARALARDQALLESLFHSLSQNVVFRTGPVRVARRDWSVELLTVEGRIGAWFTEQDALVYFCHDDLSAHDFVPVQDPSKAQFRTFDVRQALQHSRVVMGPYLKRVRIPHGVTS